MKSVLQIIGNPQSLNVAKRKAQVMRECMCTTYILFGYVFALLNNSLVFSVMMT